MRPLQQADPDDMLSHRISKTSAPKHLQHPSRTWSGGSPRCAPDCDARQQHPAGSDRRLALIAAAQSGHDRISFHGSSGHASTTGGPAARGECPRTSWTWGQFSPAIARQAHDGGHPPSRGRRRPPRLDSIGGVVHSSTDTSCAGLRTISKRSRYDSTHSDRSVTRPRRLWGKAPLRTTSCSLQVTVNTAKEDGFVTEASGGLRSGRFRPHTAVTGIMNAAFSSSL